MQPPAAEAPLVATKLFVPRPRANRVDRSRLRERLDQSRHAVLVSAPAGSGNSTLLADWAASCGERVAWISLDPADDHLLRFVNYLMTALGWSGTLDPMRAAIPELLQATLVEMLNGVAAEASPVTLILDDYHVIRSQSIHDVMQFLIDRLPPNLRIVIATRADPPLALSRLRARDLLSEVRAHDLRFSFEEAARFLNASMGLDLGDAAIAELEKRTEGWAVGLQMAAITLRGRVASESFIRGFSGSNRYVLDYLTDEVLAGQPPEVRQFLLETSILDRLSAPLCDAVTGRGDGEQILQLLDGSNLFLIPLDDVRYWYRYHHLFGTLLQHQLRRALDAESIARLHQRASDWYAANGSPDPAVQHAVAARDYDRVRTIVLENSFSLLLRGDSGSVHRWMSTLPEEELENRVGLLIYRAMAAILDFRIDLAEPMIARGESLLTDDTPSEYRAALMIGKAMLFRSAYRIEEALAVYRAASALVKPGTPWHSVVSFELALTILTTGDLFKAEEALEHPASEWNVPDRALPALLAQTIGSTSHFLRGVPEEAVAMANEALRWVDVWDPENLHGRPMASFPLATLADVHLQWNDIAAARAYADRGMEQGKRGFYIGYFEAMRARLHVAVAENDWETAARVSTEISRSMSMIAHVVWTQMIDWVLLRATLRRGQRTGSRADLETVIAAAQKENILTPPYRVKERRQPSFFAADAFLMAARVLIIQERYDHALELLGELLALSRERACLNNIIETLILRSQVEAALGKSDPAVASMQEALELASRPRYLRLFLDEGSAVLPMIERAAPRIADRDYATRLLAAFDVKPLSVSEILSERELEVLRLVAIGASNQDAARRLFISPGTVKKHLENIYAKLDVGGRTQAIARARELGIL